ncbi:MAG: anhydro-N-acetylmuramic acid kinase [Flavobacteriales bacterium]
MKNYRAIGLMSGTSLDGLDIAFCQFFEDNGQWNYQILKSKTVEYSLEWRDKLRKAPTVSKKERDRLDLDLGLFFGEETKKFISENNLQNIDFIASHGHTVFHQPDKGFTVQIGNGRELKHQVGHLVINDFRSEDVAAGGQGAPLVPIGDELLFSDYDFCVNIGGIANVSFKENGVRKAFDICIANMALNPLALEMGYPFDEDGYLAKQGIINPQLLWKLQELDFGGKSLGNEQYQDFFLPVLNKSTSIAETKIATVTEYIAQEIAKVLTPESNVLMTGGGAYNSYLISKIKKYSKANISSADKELIEFKEALIFAFLGVLKMENIPNCLSSVTGAKKDVVGGVIA